MTDRHRITVALPLRLVSEANVREHWTKVARRAKRQRRLAGMAAPRMPLPVVVTLTRIGFQAFDTDNLARAFKAIRDGVADRLGVDDNDPGIAWRYAQRRGKPREYGIEITMEPWVIEGEAEGERGTTGGEGKSMGEGS